MLNKSSGESKKVYIIIVIRHMLQVVENKTLTRWQNQGITTGQNPKISSHLWPIYGLFVPYLGKICALFRGFIPLEKMI